MGGQSEAEGQARETPVLDSPRLLARLTFFYCGKGDTILIEDTSAQPSRWGLVDCCLTRSSGAHTRLRQVIKDKSIHRLEFVCLSHPDYDHFLGMRELLVERFLGSATDEPALGQFWDSGVAIKPLLRFAKRFRRTVLAQHLAELYQWLAPFWEQDRVDHWAAQPGWCAEEQTSGFVFGTLSPRRNRVDRFEEMLTSRILKTAEEEYLAKVREESNNLSVVLAMWHRAYPVAVLFGADASIEVWQEAIEKWRDALRVFNPPATRFGAVKVSHHGSQDGLYKRLYRDDCKGPGTVAILSVGPGDPKHPDPQVVQFLQAQGIRVHATCWPTGPYVPAEEEPLFAFVGEEMPPPTGRWPQIPGHDWADIELEVWSDGRITVTPERSLLRPVQVPASSTPQAAQPHAGQGKP